MHGSIMKFTTGSKPGSWRRLKAVVALGVIGLSLAGCVVYPSGGYGYAGGGGYYGGPAYYAPPVVVGYGWGGGWGGGGWGRSRWR
jgi:hypothetical protein